MVDSPIKKDFNGMVDNGIWQEIAQTIIPNDRAMFGLDLAGVWGKTVRKKPDTVTEEYVVILVDLVLKNKAPTMAADMFFIDGIC